MKSNMSSSYPPNPISQQRNARSILPPPTHTSLVILHIISRLILFSSERSLDVREEITKLTQERNSYRSATSSLEDQIQKLNAQLQNLHFVLEQFQRGEFFYYVEKEIQLNKSFSFAGGNERRESGASSGGGSSVERGLRNQIWQSFSSVGMNFV